jgi:hypothetical protein
VKTYLSIDMDFFAADAVKLADQMPDLIHAALKKRIPVQAVMNHQQMLPFVNVSKARQLVNLDAHSDLESRDVITLNCGSWVSYVRWRKEGTYLWIRNEWSLFGSCNGEARWNKDTDWENTRTERVSKSLQLKSLLNGCVGVGLAMSPWYTSKEHMVLFRILVEEFELPYKKGRMREMQARSIRPNGERVPRSLVV